MLEHAVEERLLLIYADLAGRLRAQTDAGLVVLMQRTAGLVRKFVEDFHQRVEEQHVFPLFETNERLVPLLKTLKTQHAVGRLLTDRILGGSPAAGHDMSEAALWYIYMLRPHMAREATDVFQHLYEILSAAKIEEMGDAFEERQDQVLGENGLVKLTEQVAALEKELGLDDLNRFTPKV